MPNDFFTRQPKRRPPNPFLEPWELAAAQNRISLPRAASIEGRKLGKDQHNTMICDAWGCKPVEDSQDDYFADFIFPPDWRIDRAEFADRPNDLVDPRGDVRATIIGPEEVYGPSTLVILPRFYVSSRYSLDDMVRVMAVDRRGNRVIRQTEWISPNDQPRVKHLTDVYIDWLREVKPNQNDPFLYWSDV
jgi:hypothetical protein